MSANRLLLLRSALLGACLCCCTNFSHAQPFGVEGANNLMPASGGMGGASIARPQDFLSSINENPAALTQYEGTQFTFSGTWAEPTFNLATPGYGLPGQPPIVSPFSAKSGTPGILAPNIGVLQQMEVMGRDLHVGLALISASGLGTSFVAVPESGGTASYLLCLEVVPSVGFQLTDRLSVGAGVFLGTAFLEGPYVGQSAMTNDYALRANVGFDYDLSDQTTIGMFWKTRQNFRFEDGEIPTGGTGPIDVRLGLPEQFGVGLANTSLAEGRLLIALDGLFIQWDTADFWKSVYRNQWVMQLGAQYTLNERIRLRAGYVYAQNPIDDNVGSTIGGIVVPGGNPAVKYTQAQFGVINENRMTVGCGVSDIMPGIDLDVLAGGMPRAHHSFGATRVNLESYWLGAGLTWRFGD
jgi:long-chain fatty acid transport protein